MKRGDVVVARLAHPSGTRGKKRPAVVVQSDVYTETVATLIVAEITKNLALAGDPACLFIDSNTPDGKATGLAIDSVVSCLRLTTVYSDSAATSSGIAFGCHEAKAQRLPESGAGVAVKA